MTDLAVADTLETIVGTIHGQPSSVNAFDADCPWYASNGPKVLVASYQRDFERLWAIGKEGSNGLQEAAAFLSHRTEPLTMLIVWDGSPPLTVGPVSLVRSLTPCDWAAGLSFAVAKSVDEKGTLPPLRIFIIDLRPSVKVNDLSVRYPSHLVDHEVPWLSWIHMVLPLCPKGGWDLEQLIRELRVTGEHPFSTTPSLANAAGRSLQERNAFRERLEMARVLWASEVNRNPGLDRHLVSNLLAPLILLRALGNKPTDAGRDALLSFVQAIEARNDDGLADAEVGISAGNSALPLDLSNDIDVWLVDDQHQVGWGEFVCEVLRVPFRPRVESQTPSQVYHLGEIRTRNGFRVRIRASDDPEFLFKVLEHAFADGSDARFELQLDPSAVRAADDVTRQPDPILLLDLRLFSSRGVRDEARYFRKLVKHGRALNARGVPLGWPSIPDAELEAIDKFCNEADVSEAPEWRSNTAYYLRAITLLPRLLALADFSLPIMLFSSTGQRRVMDCLREYKNVITLFEKPRLFGYQDQNVAASALEAFEQAWNQAYEFLRSRRHCQSLVRAGNPYRDTARLPIDASKKYHLELYIDETAPKDSPGWRVGGCFALFDAESRKGALRKADVFEDHLVTNGLRYFYWKENGPQPESVLPRKYSLCVAQLSSALEGASKEQCAPLCLGALSLEKRMSSTDASSRETWEADQTFLEALDKLVETFLYETTYALLDESVALTTFSIYANRRVNNLTRIEKDAEKRARCERYQLGAMWHRYDGKVLQESFREDDFAPRVLSMMRRREARQIVRALAIEMPYQHQEDGRQEPRSFVCWECEAEVFVGREDFTTQLLEQLKVGDTLKATWARRVSYGWRVEVAPNVEGFVPHSLLTLWRPWSPGEVFKAKVKAARGYDAIVEIVVGAGGERRKAWMSTGWEALTVRRVPRYDEELIVQVTEQRKPDPKHPGQTIDVVVPSALSLREEPVPGEACYVRVEKVEPSKPNLVVASVQQPKGVPLKEFTYGISCPICGDSGSVRPDARALLYVADQVISDLFGEEPAAKYGKAFETLVAGEFEDSIDEAFEHVLEASRCLGRPRQDLAGAAASLSQLSPQLPRPGKDQENAPPTPPRKPPIRDYVRWRVGNALRWRADGTTFQKIVRQLEPGT